MKWIKTPRFIEVVASLVIIGLVAYGLVITVEQAHGYSPQMPLGWNWTSQVPFVVKSPAQVTFGTETPDKTVSQTHNMDIWLDKLEKAENCPSLGIIDTNGLRSYGPLCFQERTFVNFSLRYNVFPNSEKNELPNLMSGRTEQRKLAKIMLEKDPTAWTHWINSVKVIGKP